MESIARTIVKPETKDLLRYATILAQNLTTHYVPEDLRGIATYGLILVAGAEAQDAQYTAFLREFDEVIKPGYESVMSAINGDGYLTNYLEDQTAIQVYEILKETIGL